MFGNTESRVGWGFFFKGIFVFTGEGFSLNSGFTKNLSTQEMDLVLFWFHENVVYTRETSIEFVHLMNCYGYYMSNDSVYCSQTFVSLFVPYI